MARKVVKSAVTGKFVNKLTARRYPAETFTQSVLASKKSLKRLQAAAIRLTDSVAELWDAIRKLK